MTWRKCGVITILGMISSALAVGIPLYASWCVENEWAVRLWNKQHPQTPMHKSRWNIMPKQ